MVVYGRLGAVMPGNSVVDVASAPGFLAEDEITARYAAHSERDRSGRGSPTELQYDARTEELREALLDFMDSHVYPAEATFHQQLERLENPWA